MAGTLRQAMVFLGLADDGYEAQPAAQGRRADAETAAQPRVPAESRERRDVAVGEDSSLTGATAQPRRRPAEERPAQAAQREQTEREASAPARRRSESSAGSTRDDRREEYRAPVTPINRAAAETESDNELRRITTIHPRSYNDAKVIGESFRNNIPVIMNVTDMDVAEAKRLVDFSSGLTFALEGSIERVTEQVFLLTPANLEVLASDDVAAGKTHETEDSLFDQN